jgi:type III pantothenate kinase
VLGPGIRTGMALAIDNPHELGADRIANGVAAYRRHGGPCLVVDFGTSTNFDAVSADGAFLGGAIAPGIEISVDALIGRAARLFKVDLVAPERAVGKNTVESLQSGIATGGLAGLVCRFSQTIHEHDPFLTLDGLRVIHELNVPSTRSG